MAKSSRQTFKKRQREMNKKQKKADKAKRLSTRKGEDGTEENPVEEEKPEEISADGKPTMKVFVVGGTSPRSNRD